MSHKENPGAQMHSREEPTVPLRLVSAGRLLGELGESHPLYLPRSEKGELWTDFSQLRLLLPALAQARRPPVLPIDLSPLMALCRQHQHRIQKDETWTYQYFYLEVLAQEGRLRPLFWSSVGIVNKLCQKLTPSVPREVLGQPRQAEWLQSWAREAEALIGQDLIDQGVVKPEQSGKPADDQAPIELDDKRPWLSRLRYQEPADEWSRGGARFSDCLVFERMPFYHLPSALGILRTAMTLETWRTAVFCPTLALDNYEARWKEGRKRFGLDYRRRTDQQLRKLAFERFVGYGLERGLPIRQIAREAADEGLYPFGTPKRGKEPDDAENCRRAIYSLLKKKKR